MNLTLSPYIGTLSIEDNNFIRKVSMEKVISVTTKAYLAGAVDGDGSFSIIKHDTKANPNYYPLLQFTNWRKEIVYFLKDAFGGSITTIKPCIKKDGFEGHKIYRWRLRSCDNVRGVLEQLIPFLKIKQERAQFLLDFVNNFEFIRGYKIEKDILEQRERARLKMIDFNCWRSTSNKLVTKTARFNSTDSIFWAYVAGIIDTDGSFSIKRQKRNKGTCVIHPRYLPVISISSIDTRAVNYIKENCCLGKVYQPKNKDASRGYHYQFGIYSRNGCSEFIQKILPFLVGKKENAKVLLEFCVNAKNTKYCRAGIPIKELKFREDCYQKLIMLNKYGVYKSSLMDLKLLPDNAEDNKAEAGDKLCTVNAVSGKTPKGDAEL